MCRHSDMSMQQMCNEQGLYMVISPFEMYNDMWMLKVFDSDPTGYRFRLWHRKVFIGNDEACQ